MRSSYVGDVHFHLRKHQTFEENRFASLIALLIKDSSSRVIFTGDLFDKARPTLEEIKFVTNQLILLSGYKEVYILPGNHEAVTLNSSTYDYITLPENIHVVDDGIVDDDYLIGWHKIMQTKPEDLLDSKVLVTHLRCNLGRFIKEEYDIQALSEKYELVIMGDIHQRHKPFDNVYYTSSPYSTKFLSSKAKYGYLQVEDGEVEYIDLDLPQKVSYDVTYEEFLKLFKTLTPKDLYKITVTGTAEELENLNRLDTNILNIIFTKLLVTKDIDFKVQSTKSTKTVLLDSTAEALDGQITKELVHEILGKVIDE